MATDTPKPTEVIQQMIDLRMQLIELEDQIETLKPAFFEACAIQGNDRFEHAGATITRRLTPGRWTYPNHITTQEDQLKFLKAQFRKTHEPTAGREIIWSVKLI